MSVLYRNWFMHNMVGHPLSELVYWLVRPFVSRGRAENASGFIHDLTLPDHPPGTGRG